jgi:neutral ceramidase
VRRSLSHEHGLEPSQVMLAASHTHWGPPTLYRMNSSAGAVDPWYLRFLEDTLIRLAGEALAKRVPARLSYTALDARIGDCRRTPDGHGSVKWGPYPTGSYDPHTPVLCIDRGGRAGRIILVSHACHPTSTGSVNKWSPEYPGAMRERI